MSVLHRLPPGWLLDHLSFINKVNYQIQQHQEPSCSRNKPTSSVDLDSLQMDGASPSGAPTTCSTPDSTAVPANEMITQNYAFRPELFNVSKPHITSAVHKEGQQSGQNEDLVTGAKQDVSISIGKKRKRSMAFNQGELDAMEYHTKIRELILGGSSQLIQEGLKSGVLCPVVETQHGNSGRLPLPLDACNLSELCEMAKHLPSLDDMHLQTLPLTEDDMSVIELDLWSQVIENNSSFSRMITLMGQKYLLPPNSSFLLSDISCMQPLLNCSKTFDVIVIDPPWQNKSVKRSNRSTERLHQARRAVFGIVCSEFTARLDELGQRSPQVSARGLFHCSGVWTLTVKVVLPLPQLLRLISPWTSQCVQTYQLLYQCAQKCNFQQVAKLSVILR
ncbi:N(6)-adenine-specific methyltransferase METTL4 isoform X4 [Arvicola amphibius]|uniref:N(6)-adenine-specific methyltransferase METTL4 isoform X4 n=1 Tax=Arvicola amphibius TaxID=1047088 RepID=UPI0018E2BBAE|nr:N(6)-adenine-specific methyltransferase METTL4 isoform X4 [Arvicola amphibius]